MRHRRPRLGAVALGATVLVGSWASAAEAHERRSVGPVQMVVGWLNEPAYAGFLNAVQLRVNDDAGPITDLGDGLKVEVRFGDQKVGPAALTPAFGSPGEYRSAMIPTRPGTYTFHFVGSVRGQQVDQSFTSSDTTFEAPKESSEIEFPAKDPTRAQLGGRLERVEPRIDALGATARAGAADAKSAADHATLIGLTGLLVGLAGLAMGLLSRRRRGVAPAPDAASVGSRTRA